MIIIIEHRIVVVRRARRLTSSVLNHLFPRLKDLTKMMSNLGIVASLFTIVVVALVLPCLPRSLLHIAASFAQLT